MPLLEMPHYGVEDELGLQVLLPLEADVLLDGHEADLPLHQLVDELDDLAQAAAQAGQLADDQEVTGLQRAQQLLDAPPIRPLPRGDLDLDEAVDGEALLPGVVQYGELLVGQVLGTGGDPQVGDCFHAPATKRGKTHFSSRIPTIIASALHSQPGAKMTLVFLVRARHP